MGTASWWQGGAAQPREEENQLSLNQVKNVSVWQQRDNIKARQGHISCINNNKLKKQYQKTLNADCPWWW